MLTFNLITMIILVLILTLYCMMTLLKKKIKYNFNKLSAFECGFQQMTPSSTSISIPFFLITLIFLIFDIEISIMFPLIASLNTLNNMNLIKTYFLAFILILIAGLLIEWKNSAIMWMKM